MVQISTILAVSAGLASFVVAHPGGHHPRYSAQELQRRRIAADARQLKARNCAAAFQAHTSARKAKRALAKRAAALKKRGEDCDDEGGDQLAADSTATSTVESSASVTTTSIEATATASYSTIQNDTCVLTPEVTEGPYMLRNDLIRTNLTEEQGGIELLLDIGLIDVDTCTPMVGAWIDIWHANATGEYSGFASASLGSPSGGGGSNASVSSMSMPSSMASMSAAPSGGGMGSSGGGGGSTGKTDNDSFCRGAYPTNSEGVVEFQSVLGGWYSGRTVHIHTSVMTNVTTLTNGSIVSDTASVRHIGQIFFADDLITSASAYEPYASITTTRTYNDDDSILQEENSEGYNALADTELLGDTIDQGVLAYITIGVSASATGYSFTTTNYYE